MSAPDPHEKELIGAQRAYVRAKERRTAAVIAAYWGDLTEEGEHRWTAYRIAKAMGVPESVVRAIIKAAPRKPS